MSSLTSLNKNYTENHCSILIVEDDSNMRLVIKQALQVLGCKIIEVGNGLEAQEICKKKLPDVIVLDLMMPKMGGMEFMKWFRAAYQKPYVPVLMLTALSEIEDKIQGFDVGTDDYLVKPFNLQELRARVQALIKIKKLTNELYLRNEQLGNLNLKLQSAQQALLGKERELVTAQMAGATAHNLGQPVTAIALHCRLLEKNFENIFCNKEEASQQLTLAKKAVESIKKECKDINQVMERLKQANPQTVSSYVEGTKILDI